MRRLIKQLSIWHLALLGVMTFTACNSGKQEQATEQAMDKGLVAFIYEIKDIFTLKSEGVVLVGETYKGFEGSLSVGEKQFTCTVTGIERPDQGQLQTITSDGRNYAIAIEGKQKSDFEIKGYLAKGDFEDLRKR